MRELHEGKDRYLVKEVAEQFGINSNALRFYEKKGLLCPERDDNGYRVYSARDVEVVQAIVLFRSMGFSVEDVKRMIVGQTDRMDIFFRQYDLLNRHVHDLAVIRDSLGDVIEQMFQGGSEETKEVLDALTRTSGLLAGMNRWTDRWHFDDWAGTYDEDVRRVPCGLDFYRNYDLVLDKTAACAREKGNKIAEIGVGTGELAKRLVEGRTVIGIDQSANMLKLAKRKLPQLSVRLGTFLHLPLNAGAVDTVVSSYAFHHCDGQERELAIREMKRVLTDDGRIVIADLMFRDEEARRKFEEECSDAEKRDLEDEYFPYVDELMENMKLCGFWGHAEQVDRLIWIVTGERCS